MTLFNRYLSRYEQSREENLTLQEYLDLCKRDASAYASAAERLLMAIGEPEMVDTRNDSRLSRIFQNKILKIYPAFQEFYGMEEAIEQIVSYLKHAA
ncbi:MAG: PrkA family serine protein kinase, partial [Candidatus Competibacter denitrificans]